MLLFSHRLVLQRVFERWARERHADSSPMNVIAWMQQNELLNESDSEKLAKNHYHEFFGNGDAYE